MDGNRGNKLLETGIGEQELSKETDDSTVPLDSVVIKVIERLGVRGSTVGRERGGRASNLKIHWQVNPRRIRDNSPRKSSRALRCLSSGKAARKKKEEDEREGAIAGNVFNRGIKLVVFSKEKIYPIYSNFWIEQAVSVFIKNREIFIPPRGDATRGCLFFSKFVGVAESSKT